MRKILVSMILVMIVNACACADIIYTTDAGNLGLIKVQSQTSVDLYGTQYSGVGRDSLLDAYWNSGTSRIILVDRTTNTATSGDTALIFKPSDLTHPIDSEPKVLSGVYDTQALVSSYNGKGLFFASGASIHEFSTEDFSLSRSYRYTPDTSEDITPSIKSLLTGQYTVYALVEQDSSEDILLVFDGQLRDDTGKNFAKYRAPSGAEMIVWLKGSVLALAHDDGVSYLNSSVGFYSVVSSDAPVKALCRDSGSGFYFAEQVQSGDSYTTTLRHYSSETKTSTTLHAETGDSVSRLLYDDDGGVLAALLGNKVFLYNLRGDALIAEYDNSLLGGKPVQIALSYSSGDDGKNSSGCDMSGGGILLLLIGAMIFRRR